jgi:cold-inducible RNA-binding protein
MGNRLYVGNLSYETNEVDLRTLFGQAGTVVEVKVVADRETGRPRGFAFVEMSSAAEATQAIEQVNGRELGGRTLKGNEAEDRAPRARASGGGGGGGGGGGRRW